MRCSPKNRSSSARSSSMFMKVTCPSCGEKCRVPEAALGSEVQCPGCMKRFQCGTASPPSLATHPLPETPAGDRVHLTPEVSTAQEQTSDQIHYRCPRCTKPLQSPAKMAGEKTNCPECNQRLQIPRAQPAAPVKPIVSIVPEPPAAPAKKKKPKPVVAAPDAPARSENCLECGIDVSQRQRLQTCPDCGSLFCSAMCYREHRYHAHPRRD